MVMWLLGVGLASAADQPTLAVPVGEDGAPQAHLRPRVQLPDTERLAAMAAFRSKRLSLRSVADVHAAARGRTLGVYTSTWGPWGPSWSWMWVPQPPEGDGWVVVQGGAPLDVPSTLAVLADPEGTVLEQRIRTLRTTSTAVYTLGVAGLGTSVVGLWALDRAEDPLDSLRWTAVTATGVGMLIAGVVGGTIPASRANRLQFDASATIDRGSIEERIDRYNAELLQDLGLVPGR
ncbi:MAG: hypothetical protein R3F59_11490 [Myxococcota bacterium]